MQVMPVHADFQRQHTLLTQRALPHFKNTVTGTGTHNSRENFLFFFNFVECEVRLQPLPCLATDKTKMVLAWISHLFLIYCTGRTRDTDYQWVTRADRKLLVGLDNQELKTLLKKVYTMQSMSGVCLRKQCQRVRKMDSLSKQPCGISPIETALGLLEASYMKVFKKNNVEFSASCLHLYCVQWQWPECNWHEYFTIWRDFTGHLCLFPTGCRNPCYNVPGWQPGMMGTSQTLDQDYGWLDSVEFNAWLSI